LAELLKLLQKADYMVLDTETSALDPFLADLVGLSVCINAKKAFYIPLGHKDEEGKLLSGQLSKKQVLKVLKQFLEDEKLPKLGHNLKFDYSIIKQQGEGTTLKGPLWDTMIASYLLDPGRRTFKLDDLSREILDLKMTSFSEVTQGDKRPDAFVYVSLEDAGNYSCEVPGIIPARMCTVPACCGKSSGQSLKNRSSGSFLQIWKHLCCRSWQRWNWPASR
jgi:DNA polymerase-1